MCYTCTMILYFVVCHDSLLHILSRHFTMCYTMILYFVLCQDYLLHTLSRFFIVYSVKDILLRAMQWLCQICTVKILQYMYVLYKDSVKILYHMHSVKIFYYLLYRMILYIGLCPDSLLYTLSRYFTVMRQLTCQSFFTLCSVKNLYYVLCHDFLLCKHTLCAIQ